jgi:hypothetical protein
MQEKRRRARALATGSIVSVNRVTLTQKFSDGPEIGDLKTNDGSTRMVICAVGSAGL